MLDWMKDKLGRKQSPLQALVAGEFKNDEEKRALLELLGTQEKLKGEDRFMRNQGVYRGLTSETLTKDATRLPDILRGGARCAVYNAAQ